MLTIIVFILILGVLVFVHELGHFLVARRNGIKAEEFGFGFPPRIFGYYKNEKTGKWKFVKGGKEIKSENTLYSVNWFPIGGFVKIKGENGDEEKDEDSFASKSAWTRIKVLLAGVLMNFILAWVLLSCTFLLGTYQDVTGLHDPNAKVLAEGIEDNSPAQMMGMHIGDVLISGGSGVQFHTVTDVQDYVNNNKGKEITLVVERGKKLLTLSGVPRVDNAQGQGALGLSNIGEVVTVRYSLLGSLWNGLVEIGNIFLLMFFVIKELFSGNHAGLTVTGVVGIASYTGQIIPLGFSFLLRFAAILSVNLGFINALPIPALDGGRILFILIEKIKGSPVNQRTEQIFHTVGFFVLITLMIVVTYFDLIRIDILGKIRGLF
jgi:regulator of sigma E protease